MQIKQFSATAKTFKALQDLAVAIRAHNVTNTLKMLEHTRALPQFAGKKGWKAAFDKLANTFQTGLPSYTIMAMGGNSKLPFVAFSTLPGVTCPGAGDCLDFCYSFRAWRYPAAFARMAQNAFLMRHYPNAIATAMHNVDASFNGSQYDMRLYVDGDFSNNADVAFWFNLIKQTPNARVYGYSKSFAEILSYTGQLPSNYMLNISSGHNANNETVAKVKALSITRGEFLAVSIGRKVKGNEHGTVAVNKALREAFGAKAFPCPGSCGTCTGKGHACGMSALKNIPIIIAIH